MSHEDPGSKSIFYDRTNRPMPNSPFSAHPEWFGAFLANTDQKFTQTRHLVTGIQKRYPHVWRRVTNPNDDLRLLLAGAGTGVSEIAFLQRIKEERGGLQNVRAYYQDPSTQMFAEFTEAAKTAQVDQAIDPHHEPKKFEDPSYQPPDVDIFTGFQMWHYVGRWLGVVPRENSLRKLASAIQQREGVALVSLQSRASDFYALRAEWTSRLNLAEEITSERVCGELDRQKIPYDHIIDESRVNIASMYQNGTFNPTEEGKNLLSFAFRWPWDQLSREQKADAADDITFLLKSYESAARGVFIPNFLRQRIEEFRARILRLRDGYIWIPRGGGRVDLAEDAA